MHRLVLGLWDRHQPAVLLVTHDVDEALALADRVLVLTDGGIGYLRQVDAPRPRDRPARPDHRAPTCWPSSASPWKELSTNKVPSPPARTAGPLAAIAAATGRGRARRPAARDHRGGRRQVGHRQRLQHPRQHAACPT